MTQTKTDQWIEGAAPDAGVRDQLVAAAGEHFSKYGYEKTTLAELAKAVGFSKTYFYRFFASKQEIGEAICSQCLGRILTEIDAEIAGSSSATEKLRRTLRTITTMAMQLFFEERKLYDIAAISTQDAWKSSSLFRDRLVLILRAIIQEGRENGEFERKTPIDEVTRAILLTMTPFNDPRILQNHLDLVPEGLNEVISLVLRSLAP